MAAQSAPSVGSGGASTDAVPVPMQKPPTPGRRSPTSPVADTSARSIRQRLRALQRTLRDGEATPFNSSPRMETQRRHLIRMVHALHRHETQQARRVDQHRLDVLDRAESNQLQHEQTLQAKQNKKHSMSTEWQKEAKQIQEEELKKHSDRWWRHMTQARTRVMNGLLDHHKRMDLVREERERQSSRWDQEKRRRAAERERKRLEHEDEMRGRMERIAEENDLQCGLGEGALSARREKERDAQNHRRIAEQNRRLAQARQDKFERALRAEQKRLRFARKHSEIASFEKRAESFQTKQRDRELKMKELSLDKQEKEAERLQRQQRRVRDVEARHGEVLDTMFRSYDEAQLRRDQRERWLEQKKRDESHRRLERQRTRDSELQRHRAQYMKMEEERKDSIEQRNYERWTRHAESFTNGAAEFSKLLASPPPRSRQSPPTSGRRPQPAVPVVTTPAQPNAPQ